MVCFPRLCLVLASPLVTDCDNGVLVHFRTILQFKFKFKLVYYYNAYGSLEAQLYTLEIYFNI